MIIKVFPVLFPMHVLELSCAQGRGQAESWQLQAAQGRKGRGVPTGIMTLTCPQGRDHAGITGIVLALSPFPFHLEWKEAAPIPSPALSIHSDAPASPA